MTKKEFIHELREALDGMVPPSVVDENVSYYEEYFISQKNLGKTEEEICEELGNPRLLAKSILEARGGENYGAYWEVDEETRQEENDSAKIKARFYDLNSWKVKFGCFLSAVLIILCVFFLFHIFAVLIAVLSPVLLGAAAIYFIYRLIKKP